MRISSSPNQLQPKTSLAATPSKTEFFFSKKGTLTRHDINAPANASLTMTINSNPEYRRMFTVQCRYYHQENIFHDFKTTIFALNRSTN